MACNCATDEQIKELYRRYGDRNRIEKGTPFKVRFKKALYTVGVFLSMLLIVPLLVLYVLGTAIFTEDKKINVARLFRLNKQENLNVRQQQVI